MHMCVRTLRTHLNVGVHSGKKLGSPELERDATTGTFHKHESFVPIRCGVEDVCPVEIPKLTLSNEAREITKIHFCFQLFISLLQSTVSRTPSSCTHLQILLSNCQSSAPHRHESRGMRDNSICRSRRREKRKKYSKWSLHG